MIRKVVWESVRAVGARPHAFFGVLLIAYIPVDIALAVVNTHRPLSLGEQLRVERGIDFILGTLVTLFLARLAFDTRNQSGTGVRELLVSARNTWPYALWVVFLFQAGITIAFVLLVVPGIAFFTFFAFAMLSLAIRGHQGVEAFSYSRSLVRGRAWSVLGWQIVLLGVAFLPMVFVLIVYAVLPENPAVDVAFSICVRLTLGFHTLLTTCLFLNLEDAIVQPESALEAEPT